MVRNLLVLMSLQLVSERDISKREGGEMMNYPFFSCPVE